MNKLRTGSFGRMVAGGGTVAKAGSKMLTYYAKRPFLSEAAQARAREDAARASGKTLFAGLSMLRGTALKMGQQLSLETDILPEAICQELAKVYHQVPPINRAIVRSVVRNGLGRSPEEIFDKFDLNAFAAASLGQVHQAVAGDGKPLAVKVQYPGIAKTIENDVRLIRQALRPMIQKDQLLPALTEVVSRLREEVDYLNESKNLDYFSRHLKVEGVHIPEVCPELTSSTVLTTTLMPGKTLDIWLAGTPGQTEKETVAKRLNEILIKGLYELHVIHADPNPGNFIIDDDLNVGLGWWISVV